MDEHSDKEPGDETLAEDAASIAGGSAIVLVGGLGERGLRLGTTWFLSGALGTTGFGIYTFAATVVNIMTALSPMGTNTGITMFGARYLGQGEQGKLKGALGSAMGMALLTGPLFALGLYLAVRSGAVLEGRPDEARALMIGAAAVLFGTPLAVGVGALVAAKDMRGQALGFQIAVPGLTLIGCLIAVSMEAGADGAMIAFATAHGLALIYVLARAWRWFGPIFKDTRIQAQQSLKEMLAYSLPASFAHLLYRSNLWIDILMLTWLSTAAQVGVYKVAVAMAMLGALPVMASTTMFGPVVAELVYAGNYAKLNGLLKIVTRWLIIISAPLYLVVLLLPDLILSVFDSAYLTGVKALSILMVGQVIYLACAPAGTTLVMAGHSLLNMVNGIIAVTVNLTLNYLLIPRYGILGAATASSIAISLWPLMRLVEVWWLMKCWPFTLRTALIAGSAIAGGLGIHQLTIDLGLWERGAATAGLIVVWGAVVWVLGRTPEDQMVYDTVRARLARLRG
jgi:O-antigen/teichoic acid export membrane protein